MYEETSHFIAISPKNQFEFIVIDPIQYCRLAIYFLSWDSISLHKFKSNIPLRSMWLYIALPSPIRLNICLSVYVCINNRHYSVEQCFAIYIIIIFVRTGNILQGTYLLHIDVNIWNKLSEYCMKIDYEIMHIDYVSNLCLLKQTVRQNRFVNNAVNCPNYQIIKQSKSFSITSYNDAQKIDLVLHICLNKSPNDLNFNEVSMNFLILWMHTAASKQTMCLPLLMRLKAKNRL